MDECLTLNRCLPKGILKRFLTRKMKFISKTYLGPREISMMELFERTVTTFAKRSIIVLGQGPE